MLPVEPRRRRAGPRHHGHDRGAGLRPRHRAGRRHRHGPLPGHAAATLARGRRRATQEASSWSACLVATIDHGPLAPSALVARTIASTRAAPDERAGRRHPLVRRAAWRRRHAAPCSIAGRGAQRKATSMRGPTPPSAAERAAGRRLPGIGHRWHTDGPAGRAPARARVGTLRTRGTRPPCGALADRVAAMSGTRAGQHRRRAGGRARSPSGSTRTTATSCSPSRAASASPRTSSRSANGSYRCASSTPRRPSTTAIPSRMPPEEVER